MSFLLLESLAISAAWAAVRWLCDWARATSCWEKLDSVIKRSALFAIFNAFGLKRVSMIMATFFPG